jgi:hypothetical protein
MHRVARCQSYHEAANRGRPYRGGRQARRDGQQKAAGIGALRLAGFENLML